MKKRFSEAQIIGFLREADAGVAVQELCRRHGFSDASDYLWRRKFGGLEVSDAKRLTIDFLHNLRLRIPFPPWMCFHACSAREERHGDSGM